MKIKELIAKLQKYDEELEIEHVERDLKTYHGEIHSCFVVRKLLIIEPLDD